MELIQICRQITSSLYISSSVAACNELMLSNLQITVAIKVWAEAGNALSEGIGDPQVPVTNAHFTSPLRHP
ncbi:Dual specificity protein phosphatase 18 [Tupaia chinensis]|uniref:Dual specificity protein phosphatase 18 n=1 Tax=Tupaia chinensis TaxID=246437 RepID=L9KW90_TUPCH|nr:Dual specificity protein phosphatase 18 [Tupaia chinensis]